MVKIGTLYIFGFFLVVIFEIKRPKKKIDGLSLFNVWFSGVYFLIPGFILFFPKYLLNIYSIDKNNTYSVTVIYLSFFLITFYYLLFILTYFFIKDKFYFYFRIKNKKEINIKKTCVVLLIISIIGFYLFVLGYGGLINTYRNINIIRSGVYERNTIAAIARMFVNYATISSLFLFVYLKKQKKNKKQIQMILLLILSFICTIVFLVFSGGRAGLLFPITQLIILTLLMDGKIKMNLKSLLIIFPVFIIMLYGKELMANLSNGGTVLLEITTKEVSQIDNMIKSFVKNFLHPYFSLDTAIKKIGITEEPIYFLNPVYTIRFFLKLFGFPYQGTISHYNTQQILGIYESNIPPGIIALGYYNLLYPGVLIGALFNGMLLGLIERIFKELKTSVHGLVFYSILIDYFAQNIWNGDIRVFIMQRIVVLILIFTILSRTTKVMVRRKK